VNSPPPKPEVILTNFFAEPTVLLVPITSRDINIHIYTSGKTYKKNFFCDVSLQELVYEKTMQNSPKARLANPFQNLLVGKPPHNICKCINFFSNFRIS
jgi:hypothetical protein